MKTVDLNDFMARRDAFMMSAKMQSYMNAKSREELASIAARMGGYKSQIAAYIESWLYDVE